MARSGLRRIDVLAWRDFDDPEAGGSELHAHRVVTAWSQAGLDVSMTTSSVPGGRRVVRREGYRVIRRAGRYSVFPRSILSGAVGRIGTGDGVVEIWNGMPFFSPVWSRSPQITFLHHVHDEMWKLVLPRGLAEAGHLLEHRIAPHFYRRSRIVTLSESSRTEIVERLGLPAERISVTPPGVEPRFAPGGERSACRWWWPSGAWCGQAAPPAGRGARAAEGTAPRPAGRPGGRGLRAARPRGARPVPRCRGMDRAPRASSTTMAWSTCTARRGSWPRRRCAKAGA